MNPLEKSGPTRELSFSGRRPHDFGLDAVETRAAVHVAWCPAFQVPPVHVLLEKAGGEHCSGGLRRIDPGANLFRQCVGGGLEEHPVAPAGPVVHAGPVHGRGIVEALTSDNTTMRPLRPSSKRSRPSCCGSDRARRAATPRWLYSNTLMASITRVEGTQPWVGKAPWPSGCRPHKREPGAALKRDRSNCSSFSGWVLSHFYRAVIFTGTIVLSVQMPATVSSVL